MRALGRIGSPRTGTLPCGHVLEAKCHIKSSRPGQSKSDAGPASHNWSSFGEQTQPWASFRRNTAEYEENIEILEEDDAWVSEALGRRRVYKQGGTIGTHFSY